MKRYYYVTEELDELKAVEQELQQKGVSSLQMHVLTQADAEATQRGVETTNSFSRSNVSRALLKGFLFGLLAVVTLVALTYALNIPGLRNGLLLTIACAIVLGFFTWEGAFLGLQTQNRQFRRFNQYLNNGQHLFYVDVDEQEAGKVDAVVTGHRRIKPVGTDSGERAWVLKMRQRLSKWKDAAP